ncbi:L,D-transpeptidase [Bosea sp. AS-1]|jgi:lipoprotein-anchoring transpeptidase ErfK/SrfK|uniref:L,D-transpeptidase n=1 Tax=Bosea sp. AS-1 TaxID=2015316 RepID=UPI000B78EF58|nr:L,D-transpeptidase [Bosea sp. AS-1]
MLRPTRLAVLAGLGLLALGTAARAEIDPLTRQPLVQYVDPAKAQATAIPREVVEYQTRQRPGTIVINTTERRLYFVLPDGKAVRYGVGVGRPGFDWAGAHSITRKAEWPGWTPPASMLKRRPDLPRHMAGGPDNPLGARALYLGSTLYRIHGSNEPETIGQAVSSGCIRMLNEDVIDLYERAKVGTRVVVAR